ncbi:MAG: type I-E CRISPR-associated protein Cse1/CasA [Clostridiaceae bacterium]|nr:type I-E CRISPR-associated protein Cse1/CasA [Clostridiaceae bacterium]
MSRFNLLDENWIGVIYLDESENKLVSLKTLFEDAHKIQRIAGDTKTQDFAILRILLAILNTVYSRFDAEGNAYEYLDLDEKFQEKSEVEFDDLPYYINDLDACWDNLWKKKHFPSTVNDYLTKWHDRFYLFDDEYPFFQVLAGDLSADKISRKKASAISGKFLDRTVSESGNKVALFSPKYNAKYNKEVLRADQVARWLITYQGYTGLSDKTIFGKEKYKASKGWLYDLGGIYLEGTNLFETLLLNTILVHPRDEFSAKRQRPCWEYSSGELLEKYFSNNNPDNLAELYTTWSRAVYIDPDTDLDKAFSLQVVKLPDMNHQDQFIEAMTLWRFNEQGEHKGYFTPRKHRANQALWRSFGLLAMPSSTSEKDMQHMPELINWLEEIRDTIGNISIGVQAVSMQDDGNAPSWVPTDELVDSLQINNYVLTDVQENHWVPRITNLVEKTRVVINHTYRAFLSDIAEIRNIKEKARQDFINRELEAVYFAIDEPFRAWLAGIKPKDEKDKKMQIWLNILEKIVKGEAQRLIDNATTRDLRGIVKDERSFNIITAYNSFTFFLNKGIQNK